MVLLRTVQRARTPLHTPFLAVFHRVLVLPYIVLYCTIHEYRVLHCTMHCSVLLLYTPCSVCTACCCVRTHSSTLCSVISLHGITCMQARMHINTCVRCVVRINTITHCTPYYVHTLLCYHSTLRYVLCIVLFILCCCCIRGVAYAQRCAVCTRMHSWWCFCALKWCHFWSPWDGADHPIPQ